MKSFQRIGLWYLIVYFTDNNCIRKIDMNNKSNKYVENNNNNNNNISKNYDNNNLNLDLDPDSWEKDEDFWYCGSIIGTTLVRRCMFSFSFFYYYYFFIVVLFFYCYILLLLFFCFWLLFFVIIIFCLFVFFD